MDSRLALPVNAVLDGNYRIERVVGAGGFAVTYEAEDLLLRKKVAVKEYYPIDYGDRDAAMRILPKSEVHTTTFEWGRLNFLEEARTLARLEHPSIVRVLRVFEANSTAYMVMHFEDGHSFETWLTNLHRAPMQQELEMSSGGLDGAQRANAKCPQCHGDGHVPRHGGLRQKTCPRCNGRGWIKAPPAGR